MKLICFAVQYTFSCWDKRTKLLSENVQLPVKVKLIKNTRVLFKKGIMFFIIILLTKCFHVKTHLHYLILERSTHLSSLSFEIQMQKCFSFNTRLMTPEEKCHPDI